MGNGTDESRIAALFRGQWARAEMHHPLLYPGDRVQIARRAHTQAALWEFPDPRLLAAALGLKLCPVNALPCGGEATLGGMVFFKRTPDRRERGLSVYHGIAHDLLARERWDHSEADAWWLTGDLAVPQETLKARTLDEILRDAYVPEWFARSWHAAAARAVEPLTIPV